MIAVLVCFACDPIQEMLVLARDAPRVAVRRTRLAHRGSARDANTLFVVPTHSIESASAGRLQYLALGVAIGVCDACVVLEIE